MKKIMIVDDDVCIGDMLEELLAKENYSTVRAWRFCTFPPTDRT